MPASDRASFALKSTFFEGVGEFAFSFSLLVGRFKLFGMSGISTIYESFYAVYKYWVSSTLSFRSAFSFNSYISRVDPGNKTDLPAKRSFFSS